MHVERLVELVREWHGAALLGAAILAFQSWAVWSEWRFRRRALRVHGEVVKTLRYSKHISYYIAYHHGTATRIAEYYGPGLIAKFEPGDKLDILIDPRELPNVEIPTKTHVRWSRAGNCVPADSKLVSVGNIALITLGMFLILRGV